MIIRRDWVTSSMRFYLYVHTYMQNIRCSPQVLQWNYVDSDLNPVNHATRALPAQQVDFFSWLTGPAFLIYHKQGQPHENSFSLVNLEMDAELHPESIINLSQSNFGSARFERYSSRSEERRVGKEWLRRCRARGDPLY